MLSLFFSVLLCAFFIRVNGQAPSTEEPCAQVARLAAEQRATNPRVSPTINGAIALKCLQSVPLHKEEAMGVTGALLPYVEFQSDLPYKKAPPAGYPYPGVDLVESITRVVRSLENNSYPNEYSWQADLFKQFTNAKDGHFRFAGDLLVRPVRFTRNVSIVSLSMDGKSLPQLYVLDDIQKKNTSSFTPSAIVKINNEDATTFVQRDADLGVQQDPDSNWNTVMYNPAIDSTPGITIRGNFGGDGRAGFTYPGDNTTLTFANGTTKVIQTLARIPGNFTGVTNGESAFQKFCTNPPAAAAPAAPGPPPFQPGDPLNNTLVLKGFPKARVIASDGSASGYYLKSQANSDVGVLFLPTFSPNTPAEFQAVMETMLAEMKRDGKTKLIVDLQGNGGGIILNGFDAFRQLFPQKQDVMFARQRIGPIYNALQEVTNQKFSNFSASTAPQTTLDDFILIDQSLSHFNVNFDLTQTRAKFTSVPQKFGPFTVNGDTVTELQQWDWGDPLLTTNNVVGAGMTVTGYGSRQNFTQPFAAEDIVMLYDGVCASTCTLFSEMMRTQGLVKSIMLGGRPNNNRVQAVGGVKGSQSLSFEAILGIAQPFITPPPNNSTAPGVNNAPITASQATTLKLLSDLPINRSLDNGINFSDHILDANLKDGIPAQFVREEADCRVFYTPVMIVGDGNMTPIEAQWEEAANVAFRGKACVVGGISQGIVSAREEEEKRKNKKVKSRAEMQAMVREASEARALLNEVRMKAIMEPVERSSQWWDRHGREVPMMYIT